MTSSLCPVPNSSLHYFSVIPAKPAPECFCQGFLSGNPQIDKTGFLPEACRNDKKCKAIYETPHYLRTNKIIAAMPMRYQPKDIRVWLPTRWMKDLTAISAEIKETINPTAKREISDA